MRSAYIIRRFLVLIPTLFAIYTVTFFLMHATPGGPWDTSDKPIPIEVQQRIAAAYGFDKPLWRQYVDYLGQVVRGDLGPSYVQRSRTVADILKETYPIS